MASSATVEIILQAKDTASAALQGVTASLQDMQKAASAAIMVFGAISGVGAAAIGQITLYAARTQELGVVLANTAEVMGYTQEEVNAQEQALRALNIRTQESRELLMRLMASEIDLSYATKIARAAQDLAVIGMNESSEAASDLIYALASLQPRLIRKYGIYVTLVEVYRDAAEALGKNVDELTALEKRLAFTNAVLDAAANFTGAYEAAMTSASKVLRSIPRLLTDIANALGQTYMPAFTWAVMAAYDLLGAFAALPPEVHTLVAVLLALTTGVTGTLVGLGLMVIVLSKLFTALAGIPGMVSALINSLQLLVTAFGIATGAATTLQVALIALGAVTVIGAVIAGIALLAVNIGETNRKFQEAHDQVLLTATSYEQYRRMVLEAGVETGKFGGVTGTTAEATYRMGDAVALSREQFELFQWAVIQSGGAVKTFAEAKDYLAAFNAEVNRTWTEIENTRNAMVTWGAINDDVYTKVENLRAGIVDFNDALTKTIPLGEQVWSGLAESATAGMGQMVASTEQGATSMGNALTEMAVQWYGLSDEVEFWGNAYENSITNIMAWNQRVAESTFESGASMRQALEQQAIAQTQFGEIYTQVVAEIVAESKARYEELIETTRQAFDELAGIITQYHAAVESANTSHLNQMVQTALQNQISIREAEIQHYRTEAELVAKANAEIAALEAAGLTDKAAERQKKLDEELGMLDYNYETQKAWAKWHWDIQQLMQEYAHQQRLAETAEYLMKEMDLWKVASEVQITMMNLTTAQMAQASLTQLELSGALAQGTVANIKTQVDAIAALGASWEAYRTGAQVDLAAAQAEMGRLMAEINALIAAGPKLPDVPDFSQWADDYSGSVSQAGSQVRESATRTLQEVTVDIARAFEEAMKVFEEVAKYERPTGLAEGMRMLREDIQLAVQELYIAYEALGKEGVEGAGLIGEAAQSVLAAIGQAVDTFAKLEDYGPPLRSALDSILDDVKYVLVKVREELLDLWGWAGAREDTVWGHMESWATAVSGVVALVGQAAENFAKVSQYKGIMPGVAEMLAADIKQVVTALVNAIGEGGGLDEAKTQWMRLAADLIGLVAGMIDDLEKIAAFEGGLQINSVNLVRLLDAMKEAVAVITGFFVAQPYLFDEATQAASVAATAWLDLNGKLVSSVSGIIDDLGKIAAFEGGLMVNSVTLSRLLDILKDTVAIIAGFFLAQPYLFDEATATVVASANAWLELNSRLISLVAGVIEDIQKIAAFEGGLEVSQTNIENLMTALSQTAETIRLAIIVPAGMFDADQNLVEQFKATWIGYQAELVSALAGVLEDLETLAAFEGGLVVSQVNILNLFTALSDTAETIRLAIVVPTGQFDANNNLVEQFKATWIGFQAELVSTLAGVVSDLETLAAFEGGLEVSQTNILALYDALNRTAETIRLAIVVPTGQFDANQELTEEFKAVWLGFQANLVSTLAGVVSDLETLSEFTGELQLTQGTITQLAQQLQTVAGWILEAIVVPQGAFDEAGKYVDELKVQWAEVNAGLVSTFAGIVDDINKLAEFEGVDEASFKISLDALFDALYWFLTEFESRANIFSGQVSEESANIATLMGNTVGALGNCVQPILDVATFAITPVQAAAASALFFASLEEFLRIFGEHAVSFQTKSSQETADLAQIIGDTLSGIGNAVQPLIDIMAYAPGVVDIEAQFAQFFYHLDRALWWIEFEKDKWVISTAAQELSAKVDEVMGHLKTAVDFLDEMATYGEDATTSALVGFLLFLIDLEQVVAAINTAKTRITDEALLAAEEFAGGCSTMLSHITDGINTLNSLPDLELDFYQAGYRIGLGFIQGMIDGLVNNASVLYETVAAIVAAAIAAAEAAAGVASPSTETIPVGMALAQGVQIGWQRAMGGWNPTIPGIGSSGTTYGSMTLPATMTGAGNMHGGNTYYFTLEATYRDTEQPSVARQFELMETYARLRG